MKEEEEANLSRPSSPDQRMSETCRPEVPSPCHHTTEDQPMLADDASSCAEEEVVKHYILLYTWNYVT
jgi:hypothetical protein